MKIPESFKTEMEKTFYDKSIDVLEKKYTIDAEGDYIVKKADKVYNFMGNVSFSNFKTVKEEYGIEHDISIVITTSLRHKNNIDLSTLISYNDITYEIIDKIEKDSHLMLVGAVWE